MTGEPWRPTDLVEIVDRHYAEAQAYEAADEARMPNDVVEALRAAAIAADVAREVLAKVANAEPDDPEKIIPLARSHWHSLKASVDRLEAALDYLTGQAPGSDE